MTRAEAGRDDIAERLKGGLIGRERGEEEGVSSRGREGRVELGHRTDLDVFCGGPDVEVRHLYDRPVALSLDAQTRSRRDWG